jgi:hypothetical protein
LDLNIQINGRVFWEPKIIQKAGPGRGGGKGIELHGDIMHDIIDSVNFVVSNSLDRSAEREILQPFNCERKLLPRMELLFTGRVAFHKLKWFVEKLSNTTDDSLDVVVMLLPQNLAIREVRYTEANTVFLCDDHDAGKFRAISIRNGHPFGAAVEIMPKRSQTRLVTEFIDQLYPVPGLAI